MTHYLTRAVLNRKAPEHALSPLLDPVDKNVAFDAHRRLMWTLFPSPDAKRDFLWRADAKGKFLILSARKPQASRLFQPLESKPFVPILAAEDRLMFVLRVNATKDRRSGPQDDVTPGTRRKPRKDRRVDIVMHTMRTLGSVGGGRGAADSRSARRMDVASEAAREWLSAQGARRGFGVDALAVKDYRVCKLKRRNGGEVTFGVMDIKGLLSVRDPEVFTHALLTGLGRSKAYGCGLMLIRRA